MIHHVRSQKRPEIGCDASADLFLFPHSQGDSGLCDYYSKNGSKKTLFQ